MKQLYIVHPETGTVIDLSTPTFLIEGFKDVIIPEPLDAAELLLAYAQKIGYRLDNYNMTNLFFGGAELITLSVRYVNQKKTHSQNNGKRCASIAMKIV